MRKHSDLLALCVSQRKVTCAENDENIKQERMFIEVSGHSARDIAKTIIRFHNQYTSCHFNIPNKGVITPEVALGAIGHVCHRESNKKPWCFVVHYALSKNHGAHAHRALRLFTEFYSRAKHLAKKYDHIRLRILLVSGNHHTALDTVTCLKALSGKLHSIPIDVVFDPYTKKGVEERQRLALKVANGAKGIWLQYGTDHAELQKTLRFLKTRYGNHELFGSILFPTPQSLSHFRFRPWPGIQLSHAYLSNLPLARRACASTLKLYAQYDVRILLETPEAYEDFKTFLKQSH